MVRICFYPGCSLNTQAGNFNVSARASAAILGIDLVEPNSWTCCQAALPLTTDSLAGLVAPARVLAQAAKEHDLLTTLCAFCFNVLRRTNRIMREDEEKAERINSFLEEDYRGSLKVLHFMEVLRDVVGYETISRKAKRDMSGLAVGPYYGCQILRPRIEMEMDDPDNPHMMEDMFRSLGCRVVDYSYKTECCGSYNAVGCPEISLERSRHILRSAFRAGADVLALSCPLCHFNLDHRQSEIGRAYDETYDLPVMYFTQILALALGSGTEDLALHLHAVDPQPILREKRVIELEGCLR